MDKDKKLTRAGLVPIRALEIYKNAAAHIRLNDLCIDLTSDCKMITIAAREGGYEMLSIMPEVLNYVFLSHLGFLQGMDDKEDCRINSKHKGGACRWETKMN